MKKIMLSMVLLCFWGCEKEPVIDIPESESIPILKVITDQTEQAVGIGVQLEENVFVIPDHLLSRGDLLVDGERGSVLARDFDHDVAFLEIASLRGSEGASEGNVFSQMLPVIGETYFASSGTAFRPMVVQSIGADFALGDETKKNLIIFKGLINPGESGTPVFDRQGRIYSILIAADISQGISYGVRSDVLLELWEEQR